MSQIPQIIHQTWKDSNVPEHFQELVSTWKKHHPKWQYKLWTDEMNRRFISENYPGFLEQYDNYPSNIQRVDAVRYYILYHYGGVFVDIDFECFKNIEVLIKNETSVFGLEPEMHCARFAKPYIVCNAFMACKPKTDFFKYICLGLSNIKLKTKNTKIDVLESTGPFILTDLYERYTDKNQVTLIPADLVYPFTIEEVRKALNDEIDNEMQQKLEGAFALHYFWGNWWDDC